MTDQMKWVLIGIAGAFAMGVVASLILLANSAGGDDAVSSPTTSLTPTSTTLRPTSTQPTTTTTLLPTTTTQPTTTTTNNDAEAVEFVRRAASEIEAATGVRTSANLMTDALIVDELNQICQEFDGDATGWSERLESTISFGDPRGEMLLLAAMLTQAGTHYCPEHGEDISAVLEVIEENLGE